MATAAALDLGFDGGAGLVAAAPAIPGAAAVPAADRAAAPR